jgi:hypothetical protein
VSSWGAQGTVCLLCVDSLCSRIEIGGSVGGSDGPVNVMGMIDRVRRLRLAWRIEWVLLNATEFCSALVYGVWWGEVRWSEVTLTLKRRRSRLAVRTQHRNECSESCLLIWHQIHMLIIRALSNANVAIRTSVTNRSAPFKRQFVASCVQRTAAFPCTHQLPECSTTKVSDLTLVYRRVLSVVWPDQA